MSSYGPFGAMESETGPAVTGGEVANKLRYTGRELDRETGLYYYRARYYDPELGRFYTEDPLGFRAGINFYVYVSNNPINFRDPTGLFEFSMSFEDNMATAIEVAVDDLEYGGFDFNDFSSGFDWEFELDQNLEAVMDASIADMQNQATADMISSGFQSYSGLAGNQDDTLDSISNFSAGFGDALTLGGTKLFRQQLNGGNDIVDENSGAYGAGSLSGVGVSFGLGGAGIAKTFGWNVSFGAYRHGGGGMSVLKNGARRFGADWHSFKLDGRMVNRPHLHYGKTKNQMKKHRPWQGGF